VLTGHSRLAVVIFSYITGYMHPKILNYHVFNVLKSLYNKFARGTMVMRWQVGGASD